MKLIHVPMARAAWLFDISLLNPKGLSIQEAFDKLKEKYRFSKAPKHPLDLNEAKALAFEVGTFVNSKNVPVSVTLGIYNDGLTAQTQSSTDDAKEFLQEVAVWIEQFGLAVPHDPQKAYLSQLIVEWHTPLTRLNPKLTAFLQAIEAKVKTADNKPRQFDVCALNCWTEDVNQGMAPAAFRFERKLGVPFSTNQYFSQAPLETQQHIALLNELEQLLKESSGKSNQAE